MFYFRRRAFPFCAAFFQFFFRNFEIQFPVGDIDLDDISFFHQGNGAAFNRFRGNMANACATGSTGKTAVGKKGNFLVQTHAGQYGSGIQHFAEAGSALGSFVTDDDYVAGVDLLSADSRNGFFFRIEHPGRAGMNQHFFRYGAGFNNRAVRSQIALQHSNAAGGTVGVVAAADHVGTADFRVFDEGTDGLAGNGLAGFDDEAFFRQLVHNGIDTAGFVQVGHMMEAAGAEESQVGGLFGNFIKQFQRKLDAGFVSNGRQMQGRVGAAADGHIHGNGVLERIQGYEITGQHLFFDHAHNGLAAFFCQTGPFALISCRDGAVAGKGQS